MSGKGFRKPVRRISAAGPVSAGAGHAAVGDPRLEQELLRLKGQGRSARFSQELSFKNANDAWRALKAGKVEPSKATDIAFNLGLTSDVMDMTPNQAMQLIEASASGRDADAEFREAIDLHQQVVQNRRERGQREEKAEKKEMSQEEWRRQVEARRAAVDAANRKKQVRLVPVSKRAQYSPAAVTGNGLSAPSQQEGEADTQTEQIETKRHQERGEAAYPTDTVETGYTAEQRRDDDRAGPNRNLAAQLEQRKKELIGQLSQIESQLHYHGGVGALVERLSTVGHQLTTAQLEELGQHLDSLLPQDGNVSVDQITDDDITAYLGYTDDTQSPSSTE